MKGHIRSLTESVGIPALFRRPPRLRFAPETRRCEGCGGESEVRKTRRSTLITLDMGRCEVRETVVYCPRCEVSRGSEELQRLKPPKGRFGYDVLAYVGRAMFRRCRSAAEVREELRERQVRISESEIFYLAKKFIVYLWLVHRESRGRIKELLDRNGGYILHLDATCEGDSPHVMSGMDGITEIVLENEKMASEKAETIVPLLRRIETRYGVPIALVHDMGKGICRAVSQVFPGVPDLICHYHFLADVGKDLFAGENDTIRKRLSRHGVQGKLRKRLRELQGQVDENPEVVESLLSAVSRGHPSGQPSGTPVPAVVCYTLVQWALAGKKEGDGYGFPFDRPYLRFYRRLEVLCAALKGLRRRSEGVERKHLRPYLTVLRDLLETVDDAVLRKAALDMEGRAAVFDKLREAMRIALPSGGQGLNDRGSREKISTIEKRVQRFRAWVCNEQKLLGQPCYREMIGQLDTYSDKLFCDPIRVDTPTGTIVVQPQRTNNLAEQSFRALKRVFRKKTGVGSLAKTLEVMPAATPLIENLSNPEYLKALLNGRDSLQQRFADMDIHLVRTELRDLHRSTGRMPSKIKKLIKRPDLPETLVALLTA